MAEQVKAKITEADLLAYGKRVKAEVINGRIVIDPSPGSIELGFCQQRIASFLQVFTMAHSIGRVGMGKVLFKLVEDETEGIRLARCTDVFLMSYDRLPKDADIDIVPAFAPDVAVEVMSPKDTSVDMHNKVKDYLDHGGSQVWLVIPRRQEVQVFSAAHPNGITFTMEDDLAGEGLLAGFRIPVRAIFEEDNNLHIEVVRRLTGT